MTNVFSLKLNLLLISAAIISAINGIHAGTLHVGTSHPYTTLDAAANDVVPGDTILVHQGTYNGGLFIADLQGTADAWIHIWEAPGENVIFDGGTNAWQFSDAAYLHIKGFTFQHQTGNGVNFDDGGTYETPAHHIIFDACVFWMIDATGNNDLLKLSGLDSFVIRNCVFLEGAEGGSGIDMVGCHDGLITYCYFESLGSNAIQAKGGTRNIRIESNIFENAGARAVNLGGSTGLPFFRPIDAPYEAADLKVYSNVFIGSEAPVAFVGCINSEVVNNTIYLPEKWVMRILQETVDPERFPPCGFNTFRNNIIYINDQVSVEVNIGPNTAPETFTMSNNLWYQSDDPSWTGPFLPVADLNSIVGEDPLFLNPVGEDFQLQENSPAIGAGFDVTDPLLDLIGIPFLQPRSIGAFEGGEFTSIHRPTEPDDLFRIYPNPARQTIFIDDPLHTISATNLLIINQAGQELGTFAYDPTFTQGIRLPYLPDGLYFLKTTENTHLAAPFIIQH